MSGRENRESLLLPILIPLGALVVIGAALFGFSRILLSIKHNAATAVALGVMVSIMGIATFVATRKKVSSSSLTGLILGVVGAAMLIGGTAIVAIGPEVAPAATVQAQVLSLTAPVGAATNGFKPTTLSAATGAPIKIELDNQDSGVPHNVAVYGSDPSKDPSATVLGSAPPVAGPAKITVSVKALSAGTYYFRCEVHPATMFGTLTVAPGGGSSSAVNVSAKNLQFDTTKISLPAGQASTINFDNQDSGVPHDIAIFSDKGYTTAVFTGALVTGPAKATYDVPALAAGTYYFHCDVHPTMAGIVIVGGSGGGASPPPTSPTPVPTTSPPASPSGGAPGATASISAQSLQFSTSTLTFPSEKAVALSFDNKDAGTPHNVAIYSDSGYTKAVFTGAIVTGPTTTVYDVPPLAPGTYYYRCDVHTTMTGTLTVK